MEKETDINKLFGKVLKINRKKAGYSQEEFAVKSGVHRTYVSFIERGVKSPSLTTVNKLLDVLNLSFGSFYKQVDLLKNVNLKLNLDDTRCDKLISQQIIDNSQNHILVLDLNFEIRKYNKKSAKFFNLKGKACNNYFNYFSSKEDCKQHCKFLSKVIKNQKDIKILLQANGSEGKNIFEVMMTPLFKDGCLDAIVEERFNITEQVYLDKLNSNKIISTKVKRKNKQNILLMDDSYITRATLLANLSDLGFNASAVANGELAIKEYKKAKDNKFDLVILDIQVIDGMGGIETLKKLKKLNPNLKSIAISAYNDEKIKEVGFNAFLAKPIEIMKLEQVIYDLLEI